MKPVHGSTDDVRVIILQDGTVYSRLGYGNINDDKVYGKRPVNILNVFANHFLPIPKLMMFFHLMMMAIASIFVDL